MLAPAAGYIDWQNAVNWSHPVNKGLLAWFLFGPSRNAGTFLVNLTKRQAGTVSNVTSSCWSRFGRPGGAGSSFIPTGTTSRISLSSPGHLDGTAFTISWWMYINTLAVGKCAWTKGPMGSGAGFGFNINNTGNKTFEFQAEGPVSDSTAEWNNTANVGVWQHFAFTWDGTAATDTGASLYLNGVPVAQTASTVGAGVADYTAENWTLSNNSNSGSSIDAYSDDWRIYMEVLSESRIRHLYKESLNGYPDALNRSTKRWATKTSVFAATAAITLGRLGFSASAANTSPNIYTATAPLTLPNIEPAATATFANPVDTATAALALGNAEFTASAVNFVPTATAAAALTLGNVEFASSSSFVLDESISQTLTFTQTVSLTHTKPISQSLQITQFVNVHKPNNRKITDDYRPTINTSIVTIDGVEVPRMMSLPPIRGF